MRAETRPPRRKWPWIVAGVIVVALIGTAIYAGVEYSNKPTDTAPIPQTTGTSSPATSTAAADAAPTGCLGGPKRDAAMVLAAQAAAPHTSNGAVDFATSFMRWVYQFPYPSSGEADQIEKAAVASGADESTRNLAAFFATKPNLTGAFVPDDTEYYRSTVPGVWNLESYSGDQAVVSVGSGYVVSGVMNATVRASITITVVWEDNHWKFLTSAGTRQTQDLYAIGKPFTGGC